MIFFSLLAILSWSLLQGKTDDKLWPNVIRGLQIAQEGEANWCKWYWDLSVCIAHAPTAPVDLSSLCILWFPQRQLHPLRQSLWDLPHSYREIPKQMLKAQMRVGSTCILTMYQTANECTAQSFFPAKARRAFLACPDINIPPFSWCVMWISLSSLLSSFFLFDLALCRYSRSACIMPYFVLDLSSVPTLCVGHISFWDVKVWGRHPKGVWVCEGKKHQHFFLLQCLHCCAEPQMARMGCECKPCWRSLFNASLAIGWSCGSNRTPQSRVKGQSLFILPGGHIPWVLTCSGRWGLHCPAQEGSGPESHNLSPEEAVYNTPFSAPD